MSTQSVQVLVTLVFLVGIAHSANILVFIGMSSHSHRVAVQPLATKLAERGHDVTVFSPIEPESPNPKIKEFCTPQLLEANRKMRADASAAAAVGRLKDRHFDPFFEGATMFDLMLGIAEATLRSPEFIDWVQNSHFDLIIYDFGGKEFLYPLAHQMKAKVIAFMAAGTQIPSENDAWGLPLESWYEGVAINKYWWLPNWIHNVYTPLSWYFNFRDYYIPKMEALARETLPFDFPPLLELTKQFDLIFLNEHFSNGFGRAYPPYVIPVGGMHVKEPNSGTLPKDIENFIADANQFVFISFGSVIRISLLPNETRQSLFDAVASIPDTRFLWKWEGDLPQNLPKNSLAKNWLPQQDILGHPKCRGFVTQGGVMSFQQSIFHEVPMVIVPGFGDQPFNAKSAERLGIGIHLELVDITEETFSGAIKEILWNKKYSTSVKQVSQRFKDRPLSPVDTAVWWTEYVLRHDTSHLKSEAIHQTWWQRRALDFWFLLFSVCAGIFALFIFASVYFFKAMCKSPGVNNKQKRS